MLKLFFLFFLTIKATSVTIFLDPNKEGRGKQILPVIVNIKDAITKEAIILTNQELKETKAFLKSKKTHLMTEEEAEGEMKKQFSDIFLKYFDPKGPGSEGVQKDEEKIKQQMENMPEFAKRVTLEIFQKDRNLTGDVKINVTPVPPSKANLLLANSFSYTITDSATLLSTVKIVIDSCISKGFLDKK